MLAAGNAVIYITGTAWLAVALHVSATAAIGLWRHAAPRHRRAQDHLRDGRLALRMAAHPGLPVSRHLKRHRFPMRWPAKTSSSMKHHAREARLGTARLDQVPDQDADQGFRIVGVGSPEPSGLRTSSRVHPEGLGVNGRQEKELHA